MPTPASITERPDQLDAALPGAPEPACPACPHPVARHDDIGLRFCRATVASALDRACVCRPA